MSLPSPQSIALVTPELPDFGTKKKAQHQPIQSALLPYFNSVAIVLSDLVVDHQYLRRWAFWMCVDYPQFASFFRRAFSRIDALFISNSNNNNDPENDFNDDIDSNTDKEIRGVASRLWKWYLLPFCIRNTTKKEVVTTLVMALKSDLASALMHEDNTRVNKHGISSSGNNTEDDTSASSPVDSLLFAIATTVLESENGFLALSCVQLLCSITSPEHVPTVFYLLTCIDRTHPNRYSLAIALFLWQHHRLLSNDKGKS